jgi:hypothetical protein
LGLKLSRTDIAQFKVPSELISTPAVLLYRYKEFDLPEKIETAKKKIYIVPRPVHI